MTISARYFIRSNGGAGDGLIFDLRDAIVEAHSAADEEGAAAIRRVFFDHFQNSLLKMNSKVLIDYLETRAIWRREKEWLVFKTVDEPCLAYTAQKGPDGSVTLIALGICYRYPGGREDAWWKDKIQPRVQSL